MNLLASIPFPDFDPELIRWGPFAVRWYGLAYMAGFFAAYLLLREMVRRGQLQLPLSAVGDLITWAALGVIVGGRLGWWLFYHRADGSPEPWWEPIAIWHGGMSFHGGLIGVGLALALWSGRAGLPLLHLTDAVALVVPIGLFFGRLANFVNAELVGRLSDLPWAVVFPGESVARHPSQLYEAVLEGPLLLGALWLARRSARMQSKGAITSLFLLLYGVIRFLVEFTREPDPQLGFVAWGWLTMGQLLSVVIAIAGVAMLLWMRVQRTKQTL